jgi:HTH-type transcriptional regulator/antitoxin HigA
MIIHPIRNDDDHGRAMSEIERLSGSPEGTPEADALEVLVTLVDAYEAKHHAIDPPDPIEAILFRMEQQGLTRNDLIHMIGSRARVSEVLNKKRPLTLAMIQRLRTGLGISADVLVGGGSEAIHL